MLSLCPLHAQETETLVLIDTDMGKIKVKLFNDTPLHRDNFIKNVKEHRYDGLLFDLHALSLDYPDVGDTLLVVNRSNLMEKEHFIVLPGGHRLP